MGPFNARRLASAGRRTALYCTGGGEVIVYGVSNNVIKSVFGRRNPTRHRIGFARCHVVRADGVLPGRRAMANHYFSGFDELPGIRATESTKLCCIDSCVRSAVAIAAISPEYANDASADCNG